LTGDLLDRSIRPIGQKLLGHAHPVEVDEFEHPRMHRFLEQRAQILRRHADQRSQILQLHLLRHMGGNMIQDRPEPLIAALQAKRGANRCLLREHRHETVGAGRDGSGIMNCWIRGGVMDGSNEGVDRFRIRERIDACGEIGYKGLDAIAAQVDDVGYCQIGSQFTRGVGADQNGLIGEGFEGLVAAQQSTVAGADQDEPGGGIFGLGYAIEGLIDSDLAHVVGRLVLVVCDDQKGNGCHAVTPIDGWY